MTQNVKKGLLVVGIVAALVVIYFALFHTPAAPQRVDDKAGADVNVDPVPANFPLKYGSRGADVKAWQDFIYTQRYGVGSAAGRYKYVDGIFGPNTQADTLKVTGSKVVPLNTFIDKIGAPASLASLSSLGAMADGSTI